MNLNEAAFLDVLFCTYDAKRENMYRDITRTACHYLYGIVHGDEASGNQKRRRRASDCGQRGNLNAWLSARVLPSELLPSSVSLQWTSASLCDGFKTITEYER
jgi:hypothetical protein